MKSKTKTLANGLRVVLAPIQDNPAVTVMVLVDAGSFDEKAPAFGVAHFLEHMCFKGTEKRPGLGQISRELAALGAQSNAFTSTYVTGYWAKVEKRKVREALAIVSDIYLNPIFPDAEVEKERGVVLEELRMYEDHPKQLAPDIFNRLLYGTDTPAGRPIIGYEKTIAALSRDDLLSFRAAHYHPERTVVVVAGEFDERTIMHDITRVFAGLKRYTPKTKRFTRPIAKTKKEKVLATLRKSEQTHLVIGVPALSQSDPKEPVLAVLTDALGGGMSSRLFERLRDHMGACYYVQARENAYAHYGDMTIHAGVPAARVPEVLAAIREECERLVREPMSKEELARVKNHLIGGLYLGLESSDAVAEYFGLQEIEGLAQKTPLERRKAIKGVTAQEVQKLAKQLFKKGAFRLAYIGPKQQEEKLLAII